jgi:hypothetical protein
MESGLYQKMGKFKPSTVWKIKSTFTFMLDTFYAGIKNLKAISKKMSFLTGLKSNLLVNPSL